MLTRFSPNPGMVTHRSRGIDSIDAELVVGSIDTRIIVSVRHGPVSSSRSSIPSSRMFTRSFFSTTLASSCREVCLRGGLARHVAPCPVLSGSCTVAPATKARTVEK